MLVRKLLNSIAVTMNENILVTHAGKEPIK